MNLLEYFNENTNRNEISKWSHYFDIYETHFNKYRNKTIKILEIGVWHGGSLKMWKDYFGNKCEIVGIDIINKCKELEEENIKIYIGDQANVLFLRNLIENERAFDIIIDDGGHIPEQQITSFKYLYPVLNNGGTYLCEDLHTNYWNEYKGGYKKSDTFIEFTKNLIDELNAFYSQTTDLYITDFTKNTTGIHIYDSVIVFDKQQRDRPTPLKNGIHII